MDYNNKVVELCSELLQIKSYSGNEKAIVEKLKEVFFECGYDDVIVDKYGNIIGVIKGKKKGPKVLFDAHIDTVIADSEEKWTVPPFSGKREGSKIYGRGASDMKGALSAMIIAGEKYAKQMDKNFCGEIYVAGVVHEECFEGVAAREISKVVEPDYVIIGEASQLNLKIGQRGRAEILVETFGVPAHSANPEKGVNAVHSMNKLTRRIDELEESNHPILGKGILVLTDIKSAPYPGASVVPHYCKATYDRRLLVEETNEEVLAPIEDIIKELEKEDSSFKGKVSFAVGEEKCYTGNVIEGERFFPGWLFEEDEKFVQEIYKGLVEEGFDTEISHYSFCTNGSHYAGEKGIKTIGFGPSKENLAHTIDEYIEVDQLEKAVQGYTKIMEVLLKDENLD